MYSLDSLPHVASLKTAPDEVIAGVVVDVVVAVVVAVGAPAVRAPAGLRYSYLVDREFQPCSPPLAWCWSVQQAHSPFSPAAPASDAADQKSCNYIIIYHCKNS